MGLTTCVCTWMWYTPTCGREGRMCVFFWSVDKGTANQPVKVGKHLPCWTARTARTTKFTFTTAWYPSGWQEVQLCACCRVFVQETPQQRWDLVNVPSASRLWGKWNPFSARGDSRIVKLKALEAWDLPAVGQGIPPDKRDSVLINACRGNCCKALVPASQRRN